MSKNQVEEILGVLSNFIQNAETEVVTFEGHPYRKDGAIRGFITGGSFETIDSGEPYAEKLSGWKKCSFTDAASFGRALVRDGGALEVWVSESWHAFASRVDADLIRWTYQLSPAIRDIVTSLFSKSELSHEDLVRWLGRAEAVKPDAALPILRSVTRTRIVQGDESDEEQRVRVAMSARGGASMDLPKKVAVSFRPFVGCSLSAEVELELELISKDPKDPLRFRLWHEPAAFRQAVTQVLYEWVKQAADDPEITVILGSSDSRTYELPEK